MNNKKWEKEIRNQICYLRTHLDIFEEENNLKIISMCLDAVINWISPEDLDFKKKEQ